MTTLKKYRDFRNLVSESRGPQPFYAYNSPISEWASKDEMPRMEIAEIRLYGPDLTLMIRGLTAGEDYIIERSLKVGQSGWEAIAEFTANVENQSWAAPLDPEVPTQFFRIQRPGGEALNYR